MVLGLSAARTAYEMAQPLSYEAYQQRRYIPALDGLRALAILGVLFHHTPGPTFNILHGYRGVWVFFVLSGYLITTLALREEARKGRLDIRAFMIRRVFRILPLYYLTLAVYIVWVLVIGMEENAEPFRRYLLNYLLYTPEFPIFRLDFQIPFGQTWSLGIEEKFYLLWPLIAFGLLAKSRYRLTVTVGLIATMALLTGRGGWLAQMWGSYTDILIGCLVAQLLHHRPTYEKLAVLGRTGSAWAVVVVLGIATLSPGLGFQLGERLYSLVAAATIIALVTNERGPANAASFPWLVKIGLWSYAIYLTHALVLDAARPLIPVSIVGDFVSLAVLVAVNFPLCWLLHIYFEKPLIAVGRRIASRPTNEPAGAAARVSRDDA
jgi:peptidoglycan/LPS O-acetylase OafA/YrhL